MNLVESRCLASLAVFRELYDSKKDVYEIISEFIFEIISSDAIHKFRATEISQLLKSAFDFEIPEAVIKTSLKKLPFLKREGGIYFVNDISKLNPPNIVNKHNDINKNYKVIIKNLFDYVEHESESKLDDDEKHNIVKAFCNFILDNSISEQYSEYISAFIVSNSSDTDFANQLKTIKEGVVLYSGIKYNTDINKIGGWNTELTIFLDMEILFHSAGYNGEIYKQSFDDFNFFIKKANVTSRNKFGKIIIKLKYFKDIKKRIDNFFEKARLIFEGKLSPDPSNTAMYHILDGCKSPSDIVHKQTIFYKIIRENGIYEDGFNNYFIPENHKFNIEDKNIINKVCESIEAEDIKNNLKYLNYVNIRRANKTNNNFENIGYILLTGNSTTLSIAWNDAVKVNGCVPLATTLDFLTNKFWFRFSRGFGADNYPKSFEIITKAQIVLSSKLNKSVGKQFEKLQREYKNGKLTQDEAVSTIYELRRRTKKPEEINEGDLSFLLESISEQNIEQYSQEQKLLKDCLLTKDEEINKFRQESEELKERLNFFEKRENKKKESERRRKRLLLRILYIVSLIYIINLGVILHRTDNSIIGTIISIVASILTICSFFGLDYNSFIDFFKTKIFKKTT